MEKVFIDCGVREGDAIAAFLGDKTVGFGNYYKCLQQHTDQDEFEFVGFESPDYKYLEDTRSRFQDYKFSLIEKLIWTYDGLVDFDSDGEAYDCRIFEVSTVDNRKPWRHPSPKATIKQLPCIDFSKYLMKNFSNKDYIIVKLDIEGAEYDVMQSLIETKAISLINELYVEYHWWGKTNLRSYIENFIINQTNIHYRNDWP
jgi:FkbM family methyltransferase